MVGNYLLLDSCTGFSIASLAGRGRLITIRRGALIEKAPRNSYIYQQRGGLTGSKFRPSQPAVRYHITATDVACKELNQRQFQLLSAISEDESRYQVYAADRLEWGCGLKSGDDVFVKLPGVDKPVAAAIRCEPEKADFAVEIKDPEYKVDRARNDSGKNFVTHAKRMKIDRYVALDKLYKDPDQISDDSKLYSKCSDGDESEDASTVQLEDDSPKLKYCKESVNIDQSHTNTSTFELSNPRVFENGKSECKEQKTAAQEDSFYYQRFEQERKRRMEAEEEIEKLQANIEFLESIQKKYIELDTKQKSEIAPLQQESDQIKQEFSKSQIALDQFKNSIEELTRWGEGYQHEMRSLQETVNDTKQELDHSLAEKTQLEEQVQALEAEKEQLSSQVHSLSPTSQWKIDHDELIITANILGTGAWGFVKEGIFHGTQVAVKGIHQAIISVADEVIQREFSIMAQVRHPNLVLLIGAVFDDPRHKGPLIITELLDCDMRSAYEENNLDRKYRLPLLRNVATALSYLHSRKQPIIHRDVSSANVMLEASINGKWKRAKLCDFGSAKLTSRATTPAPGAAIYAAPETLPATRGKQTTKVDVYSFGVLYCEILLARLPPDLDPTTGDFSKFISDLKRLEGKDIHQTAHVCTNKNPKKRPTMKDVIQDIDCHISRYRAE